MRNQQDKYALKARALGFRARSVFKLQELDKKFGLFKPGMKVLDLGCAPGSWLQYASEKVGEGGQVVGLDLTKIEPLHSKNVKVLQGDIFNNEFLADNLAARTFDLVISDMAPLTSGFKLTDSARSLELLNRAFEVAKQYLKSSGSFVGKVFESEDLPRWFANLKKSFKMAKRSKPQASLDESKELFIIGKYFKKPLK